MALKIATVTVQIEEEPGVVITATQTYDYDDGADFNSDITLEYTSSQTTGGPIMRPKAAPRGL